MEVMELCAAAAASPDPQWDQDWGQEPGDWVRGANFRGKKIGKK